MAKGLNVKNVKTWYCVTTSYDDKGCVTAGIVDVCKADKKPKSTYKSTVCRDIYIDWFEVLNNAKQYVKGALLA